MVVFRGVYIQYIYQSPSTLNYLSKQFHANRSKHYKNQSALPTEQVNPGCFFSLIDLFIQICFLKSQNEFLHFTSPFCKFSLGLLHDLIGNGPHGLSGQDAATVGGGEQLSG